MTADVGSRASATVTWDSDSPAATERLGAALGRLLQPGDVVGLVGELGSGKTVLVRGLAAGLGCRPGEVHSPSFTLVNEYPCTERPPGGRLAHIDLYRLQAAEELPGIGWDEYLRAAYVVAVEWPERAGPWFPADHVRVVLHAGEGACRRIVGTGTGPRSRVLVEAWARGARGAPGPGAPRA